MTRLMSRLVDALTAAIAWLSPAPALRPVPVRVARPPRGRR
jgi:hypothetical protein